MKAFPKLIFAGLVVFAALQAVRPGVPVTPATEEIAAPPEVRQILAKDCYACHSGQRRLSWFDQIVPAYWLVRQDILTARQHLDFTTIGAKPAAAQKATLYEAVNMVQLGAMPLPQFVALHTQARVSPEELATLKNYLAPWTTAPNPPEPAPAAASLVSLSEVKPEWNGFEFAPDFEHWAPISFTDRGDNNTFRFVLGNEIAAKAAQSGSIGPWPDGSEFAKIAWQQESAPDGLVHPGKFIQVEFMLKDAKRFKDTEGWGWGRWRGMDLKPYGADARFVNECTGCHLPMRGDDYVYTLPIIPAKLNRPGLVNNAAAALPASLPYQPLAWRPITMLVDRNTRTTATLYGNDPAMQAVQPRSETAATAPAYGPGTILALVTWAQRDDPHWFGARIPDRPLSIEFVHTGAQHQPAAYRRFEGADLAEVQPTPQTAAQRTSFILGLTPARLP